MSQSALKKVQRRLAHVPVIAMTAQSVDGIEKTAERIIDLMGHAGSQLTEHGIFLLVGKARGKFLAFVQRARHRVKAIE